MQTVSKRELNQQTAAVLDRVTDTDDVVVTERGKARWRISAVRESDTTLARLEREGRYTPPARQPRPWPETAGGRAYTAAEADALIDETRGDH
ncbi:type II toxin-antitoxin system prevent-host-death family antitoxin [Arthrobacter sp. JSM 101049]|uniref:type II toxin-antitoxin system prevent-host-death family antitoxin n=1 Tax=Arthrobacter sp. JSM 101049 TaxID=929097 RepID=UPI003564CF0E